MQMPSPIPKSQGSGNQWGWGCYLTQTNRLSDVIVLCDVLYVCGREDGWVFEASRGRFFFTGVTHEDDFSYSVWEEVGGGGLLGVAKSNIKPLHIAYFIFVVVYSVSFFHFKDANIYCTY